MIDKTDTIKKKEAMIQALTKSLGIVTTACQSVGVSRQIHYQWCKLDENYKKQVDDINEVTLDFVEGKLYKLIQDGNPNAIFYYLNNKGKSRGYSRVNIENTDEKTTANISIEAIEYKLPSSEADVE